MNTLSARKRRHLEVEPAVAEGEEALLEFRDVDTYYGSLHILKRCQLQRHKGEIVTLLGANGAGKTTTMKTIVGIVRAQEWRSEVRR